MRKALIAAFLLVVAAIVLGSTVFREQIVSAATTPFQNVVVTEHEHESGPGQAGRHVDDERERHGRHRPEQEHRQARLATATRSTSTRPTADTSRTSRTTSATSGSTAAGTSRRPRRRHRRAQSRTRAYRTTVVGRMEREQRRHAPHDLLRKTSTSPTSRRLGMDDDLGLTFLYKGNVVLVLWGADRRRSGSYQMDLTHPIHVDEIQAELQQREHELRLQHGGARQLDRQLTS